MICSFSFGLDNPENLSFFIHFHFKKPQVVVVVELFS